MSLLYRALLRLYPSGFRREYGAEMIAMFADRSATAGRWARVGLILAEIPDMVWNALILHGQILFQDLRYAARTLRRAPGFALTVILVTALGVGANTAAFSMAEFVLVRPLPFPSPESLVRLCQGPRPGPAGWGCNNQLSPANYRDFKEQTHSFSVLGAFLRGAVNLVDGGEPQRVSMAAVSSEVLPLLGVRPHIGTVFEQNARAADTRRVVISNGLWRSRFAGDPSVLGRTLNLDGATYVVIGVMPADFNFPSRDVQLWTALQFVEEDYEDRGNNYLEAVGRLAPGVTFEAARAELDVVVERLARDFPETNEETGVSFFRMRDEYSPRYRLLIQALCGASLCILLLACANLGNMLLVRAASRERELAVRAALGAGRERLVRQLVTEGVALAALGGAGGVLVALLSFPLLSLLVPSTLPIGSAPSLDLNVLLLAALFTALTALGFGLVPALRVGGRRDLVALHGGRARGRRRRYRALLVGVQVTLSVVLLGSSGLLIRALLRVQAIAPGFEPEGVLTLATVLPKPEYEKLESREQFYRKVLTEVRRLPGVSGAAYTSGLPMVMTGGLTRVVLPGQEVRRDGDYTVSRRYITPQFFRTMGIPLLKGRDFADADADGRRPVAVVSRSFARRYWGDRDALGQAFLFQDSMFNVVGVVGDIRVRGLERTSEPQLYLPTARGEDTPLPIYDPKILVVRAGGDPLALVPAVRGIVRAADPDQPVSDVRTLADVLALQTATRGAQVRVLLALAALAMLLAGLGIHGLLAYTVAEQRPEIGMRLALGAPPARMARAILWSGVSIVLLALLPGLVAAFFAGRSLSALLFGVPPLDPPTLIVTVSLCLVISFTGGLLPALRARRVSPMAVMRSE